MSDLAYFRGIIMNFPVKLFQCCTSEKLVLIMNP